MHSCDPSGSKPPGGRRKANWQVTRTVAAWGQGEHWGGEQCTSWPNRVARSMVVVRVPKKATSSVPVI